MYKKYHSIEGFLYFYMVKLEYYKNIYENPDTSYLQIYLLSNTVYYYYLLQIISRQSQQDHEILDMKNKIKFINKSFTFSMIDYEISFID